MFTDLSWKLLVNSHGGPTPAQRRQMRREVRIASGLLFGALSIGSLLAAPSSRAGVNPSMSSQQHAVQPGGNSQLGSGGASATHGCTAQPAPKLADPGEIQAAGILGDPTSWSQGTEDLWIKAIAEAAGMVGVDMASGLEATEWAGLTGQPCNDTAAALGALPSTTIGEAVGVPPLSLVLIDQDSPPSGCIVEPLAQMSEPQAVDASTCVVIELVKIHGPTGSSEAIVATFSGYSFDGGFHVASMPLVDVGTLKLADPALLPAADLDLDSGTPPQEWWAGLAQPIDDGEPALCLYRCWQCEKVCESESAAGLVCAPSVDSPEACDDSLFAMRVREIDKKYRDEVRAAANDFLLAKIAAISGMLLCLLSVAGLAVLQAKHMQVVAAAGLGLAGGGVAYKLSGSGLLGLMGGIGLVVVGFGLMGAASGGWMYVVIAACLAAAAAGLYLAKAAFLSAVQSALNARNAALMTALKAACGCGNVSAASPQPTCVDLIGAQGGSG